MSHSGPTACSYDGQHKVCCLVRNYFYNYTVVSKEKCIELHGHSPWHVTFTLLAIIICLRWLLAGCHLCNWWTACRLNQYQPCNRNLHSGPEYKYAFNVPTWVLVDCTEIYIIHSFAGRMFEVWGQFGDLMLLSCASLQQLVLCQWNY